jgi:acyl-CoA thioesterase-1
VDPGQSYPDFLQSMLDVKGHKYRIVNAGISGDTSTDGLARVQAVLNLHPAIVIVEFGGNDGLRGIPVSNIKTNLDQMLAQLQSAKIKVLLAAMTLPRNYGADYIRSFENIYTELAAKYKVTLIPLLMSVGDDGRYMQRDGLHPDVEGNRRLAESVFQALETILRPPC